MTSTDSTGVNPIVTINGNYTFAPTVSPTGNPVAVALVMTSQGTTVLSGVASFATPETMIFSLESQDIPYSDEPADLPGLVELVAGV